MVVEGMPGRIMILQNLAKAIREQNYYAVFLEFVIVIAGVVIGFQINAWNEGRMRAASADAARANLVANLRRDIAEFEERDAYYQGLSEHADTVLAVMEAPDRLAEIGEWRFLESSFRLGQTWPFSQSRQVYRELEGKGDLDLIGGPDVRLALAGYYDSWAPEFGVTVVRAEPYRERVRQRMPMALQVYIGETCRGGEIDNWSKLAADEDRTVNIPRCPAPDEAALIAEVAGDLARDRHLLELARGAVAQMNTTRSVLALITHDAERVIAQIEGAE